MQKALNCIATSAQEIMEIDALKSCSRENNEMATLNGTALQNDRGKTKYCNTKWKLMCKLNIIKA